METRILGRTGIEVGAIGLGTEYLISSTQDDMRQVLEAAVAAHPASAKCYVDLLYNGDLFWNRFAPVAEPLRDRLVMSTHWGCAIVDGHCVNIRDDADCQVEFDSTLARIGGYTEVGMLMMVDHIDLWKRWGLPALDRLLAYKAAGKVGSIGLSCHAPDVALPIIESGAIDVLMYPVNFTTRAVAGNQELYAACQKLGVGLVAMKPYAGGMLLSEQERSRLWYVHTGGSAASLETGTQVTTAQCLQYVLDQQASTIVPGVRNLSEYQAALDFWQQPETAWDYSGVLEHIITDPTGSCVYCNHCQPCAVSIDIGEVMRLLTLMTGGGTVDPFIQATYDALDVHASDCIACGDCEPRCPYQVPIIERMEYAVEVFGS